MIKLLEFDDYIVLNLYHILSSNLVSIHASIPASSDKDELIIITVTFTPMYSF